MKPSDALHSLIHSLNMSEKRYFKIFFSRHIIGETNNYLRLFDAIEKQPVYDEAQIKSCFEGETLSKHLPSEKNYLYNQVLESLNSFHKERTFLTRSSNTLMSVEILYAKGLFDQCSKLIRKLKEEAYYQEKFSTLLLILRWETVIYIRFEDEKGLVKNFAEEQRVLEVIRIQTQLMAIAFNIQIQIDKGNAGDEFVRQQEKELNKYFPVRKEVNSFWAEYYFHSSMALLSTVRNEIRTRYFHYSEIKKIMDDFPQFIKELPAIYNLNYNNLINVLFLLGKYDETEKLIKEQRGFMQLHGIKNPTFSRTVFLTSCESELFLYYKTRRYAYAANVLKKIEPEVRKIDVAFGPLLFDLFFFMAVTELMVKNYKEAGKWLNKILNGERTVKFRKDLQVNTRLLYLIVLFESDDILLENRIKTFKRFMIREKQFAGQLKILEAIGFLSGYSPSSKNKNSLKYILQEIKKENKSHSSELLNKNFDFSEWAEEKIKQALLRKR